MAVYDKDDKLQKWRYSTKELNLLIPGEKTIKIPKERLKGFEIIHDYEINMFPIFRIEIVLEPSLYYKIIKFKDKVKFHLRIQSYYTNQDSEEKSLKRDFINDTFDLILDDNSEDMDTSTREKEAKHDFTKIKATDENDPSKLNNKFEFFLFKSDTMVGMHRNVNDILHFVTVTDALAYVLSIADVKNVVMTPAHNTRNYNQLVIPPLTCTKAIAFIDTYYGIYRTGSMIYFDHDYSYILSYDGSCTAYRTNEIVRTNIIVPKKTSNHSTECGMLVKKAKNGPYNVIVDYNTIGIRNESITKDLTDSNDIQVVDNYSGDIATTVSGAKSKSTNSVKIKENMTENPWIGTTYTAQTISNDIVIDARTIDINVDAIKPNKKFNVIFEDSALTNKYNGIYMLSYAGHCFIKDGADFCINTLLRLKKVK